LEPGVTLAGAVAGAAGCGDGDGAGDGETVVASVASVFSGIRNVHF
jgi:hypothetical protein